MSEEKTVYAVMADNLPLVAVSDAAKAKMLAMQATPVIEVWSPAEGEAIVGVIVGSRKASGAYGSGTQAILQDVDGKQWAVWLTSWLAENLRLQNAERGDICRIVFLGQKKSGFGKSYNAYDVTVEKADG